MISQIGPNALIPLIIAAIVLIGFFAILRVILPWLQAFMAGAPVSLGQVVGMRLRKVDARVVVRASIMATQAGISLSSVELERAYLRGADVEKIMPLLVQAHKEGKDVAFQDLVKADLEGWLGT